MQPLPFEAGRFDIITSIGVILCLVDPVVGFKNIARCFAFGGYLVCYHYSELGRRELMERREAVHLLAGKQAGFEKKIRIVEALDLYPRRHGSRVKEAVYRLFGFDRTMTRNVWIVDQLAHIKEQEHTIAMIEKDLSTAGLELVEFQGFPNHLEELIKDEDILEGAKELSREERYRVLELLIRPTGYLFSARLAQDSGDR